MQEEFAKIARIVFARLFSKWFDQHISKEVQGKLWSDIWPVLLTLLILWIAISAYEKNKPILPSLTRLIVPLRIPGHKYLKIPLLVCISGLLFAALGTWPYDFYILLRVVVFVTCAIALLSIAGNRQHGVWVVGLLIFALIYNPLFPIHLHRSTWRAINWVTLAIFAVLFCLLKTSNTIITDAPKITDAPNL
jgi:hypothetical protein